MAAVIALARAMTLQSKEITQKWHGLWRRLRTHELKNIRRLAHEVLLQRSDVEVFLVSSLKQVLRAFADASFRGALCS